MSHEPDPSQTQRSRHSPFVTTDWSAVRRAGDGSAASAGDALESLCRSYWPPLYAYARRRGFGPEDSRDLTQGLFADLLSRDGIAKADPERGRFRTFMLAAFSNYLSKQREHAGALKRGGGNSPISLDAAEGEEFFQLESGERFDPERLFDRRWAHQLSRIALDRLRAEFEGEECPGRFEALQPYLLSEPEEGAYAARAALLGLSVNGIKTAVRRMRLRFGVLLREEVTRTVADPQEADAELAHLLNMLSTA